MHSIQGQLNGIFGGQSGTDKYFFSKYFVFSQLLSLTQLMFHTKTSSSVTQFYIVHSPTNTLSIKLVKV